jgi:CheY-like chemotaxis protein
MKKGCQGTTARTSRPKLKATETAGQEKARPAGLVRTVIADDNAFGLKTLALTLALEGRFDLVGTATDGRQAIRLAFELRPELVLMDHRMPDTDGLEATRQIKLLKNPPLVVIVTSDNAPDGRARARAVGADGFVDKGGDLQSQLRKVFEELLGPRREQSR